MTRSVAFLSRLLEAGVDVRFADRPQIEGATGRFLLQQMVAVAELEAGMISARTKAALAAAKKRGKKLGGNRGVRPTAEMRARSTAVLKQRAATRAADIAPTIKSLLEGGATSLRAALKGSMQEASRPRADKAHGPRCRSRGFSRGFDREWLAKRNGRRSLAHSYGEFLCD